MRRRLGDAQRLREGDSETQVVRGGDSETHRDSEEETRRRRSCEEETWKLERSRRRLGDSETRISEYLRSFLPYVVPRFRKNEIWRQLYIQHNYV